MLRLYQFRQDEPAQTVVQSYDSGTSMSRAILRRTDDAAARRSSPARRPTQGQLLHLLMTCPLPRRSRPAQRPRRILALTDRLPFNGISCGHCHPAPGCGAQRLQLAVFRFVHLPADDHGRAGIPARSVGSKASALEPAVEHKCPQLYRSARAASSARSEKSPHRLAPGSLRPRPPGPSRPSPVRAVGGGHHCSSSHSAWNFFQDRERGHLRNV